MPLTADVCPEPESVGSGAPRTLLVMRHGEAVGFAADDVARELTSRGLEDAHALGQWLRASGFVVDHALVSGAVRTRSTWAAVARGAGLDLVPDVRLGLYTASPEVALDEIRLIPDDVRCAVVLGHNPTVSILASLLQDGQGDPEALTRMIQGFPPAAVAALHLSGDWATLGFGDARVTHFRMPAR